MSEAENMSNIAGKGDVNEEYKEEEKKFDGSCYDRDLVDMLERTRLQEYPSVNWKDLMGVEEAKNLLEEAVLLPIWNPKFFEGIRRPWRAVLMVGTAGIGKKMLAKALATESKSTFFNISSSTLSSECRGELEILVKILFEMARFYAPSTIYFEDIDSIGSKRGSDSEQEASRRLESELMIQMDGVRSSEDPTKFVIVLAGTKSPWDISKAMIRCFEKRIYIPLPDAYDREILLRVNLKEVVVTRDLNLEEISIQLDGYSLADITCVCRDASNRARRRQTAGLTPEEISYIPPEEMQPVVCPDDFREAIKEINKSVSKKDLDNIYGKCMDEFEST